MTTGRRGSESPVRGALGRLNKRMFGGIAIAISGVLLASTGAVAGPVAAPTEPAVPATAQLVIKPSLAAPTSPAPQDTHPVNPQASPALDPSDQLLLDVIPTPAAAASSIPSVQAFAAATGGIPRTLVLDPPADDEQSPTRAEPTMIPLPPGGWTGMLGLAGLGAASCFGKLRRFIR